LRVEAFAVLLRDFATAKENGAHFTSKGVNPTRLRADTS